MKLVEHSSLNDSTWVVWQTWDWKNQLRSSRHLVAGHMMKMMIMKTIKAKLTLCDSPGVQTLTGSLTTFVSHCSSSLQSRWSFWLVNYYSAQAKKDPILSLPIRKCTLFLLDFSGKVSRGALWSNGKLRQILQEREKIRLQISLMDKISTEYANIQSRVTL